MENIALFGVELVLVVERVIGALKDLFGWEGKTVQVAVFMLVVVLLGVNEAAQLNEVAAMVWERTFTVLFAAVTAMKVYEVHRDVRALKR